MAEKDEALLVRSNTAYKGVVTRISNDLGRYILSERKRSTAKEPPAP